MYPFIISGGDANENINGYCYKIDRCADEVLQRVGVQLKLVVTFEFTTVVYFMLIFL